MKFYLICIQNSKLTLKETCKILLDENRVMYSKLINLLLHYLNIIYMI